MNHKNCFFLTITLSIVFGTISPIFGQSDWSKDFKNPPNAYKPMPFWHINGEMTNEGITQQIKDAKYKANFSGVTVLPVSNTKPKFLSEAFFEKYEHILKTAKAENMNVILYDDTGFPSGNAGGEMEIKFPESLRKYVYKEEYNLTGTRNFKCPTPPKNLLAAVAMNTTTLERLDLRPFIKADILTWRVPAGNWKLMFFYTKLADYHKTDMHVDYLDTMAVRDFMSLTYDQYAKRFKPYFGNTIQMTFYDDVGFWRGERSWTPKFNDKFQALYGYNPELFYPALWYDIGEGTARTRIHFFNTRAELLAEGYPRLASEWAEKHGLKSTGHPPGNYDPQPVDMNGDIFKFYRHQHIPLADLIIGYGHGRNGFKLISSASDYYDKPITATEIYGALRDSVFDAKMLYRALLEIQVRGINFLVPHGMWYDPKTVGIPPLVSSYNPKVADALFEYSNYAGRSCMLLQGGKKVSDIAILYPIHSLQANFHFDSPLNKRNGHWTYPEADYLKVGDILTNEVRRDFTFIHPDFLTEEKYKVVGKNLVLDNKENQQTYHTVIIPGSSIISLASLQKIKQFFDNGGNVIATSLLPTASIETGKNEEVKAVLKHIFGDDLKGKTNANGGKSTFIKSPSNVELKDALTDPDIIFEELPSQGFDKGCFSYLHKVKQGKDIYFFANSTDQTLNTNITLRGNKKLSYWNPHTGNITPLKKIPKVGSNGKNDVNCRYSLKIEPLTAVFWMSE
jgi:alpha-L-rhamnosidase